MSKSITEQSLASAVMSPTFVCIVDRDLGRLELLLVAPGCTVQVPHEVSYYYDPRTSFSDSLPPSKPCRANVI